MQLVVGRIGRPHGIRGEVSVQVRTDDPGRRFAAGTVLATEPAALGPLTVVSSRWHSGRLLVSFAGSTDRGHAESLTGAMLVVDSAEVGAPEDPEVLKQYESFSSKVTVGERSKSSLSIQAVPAGSIED